MKNKNGFTMIELMIVMAIIGIMSAVIFVNMANVGTNNNLKLAGRQLSSALHLTQSYALTGKQKDPDKYPCAFKFSTKEIDGGFYYEIQYIFREVNEECGDKADFEPFEGPIKFNKVASLTENSVTFNVPHATYSAPEPETEFIFSEKGKTYKVTVFSSGVIQEGDEE